MTTTPDELLPKQLHPAEVAKLEAEARAQAALTSKLEAEAAHSTQLARKTLAEADFYEVNARQQLRLEEDVLAGDRFHHIYTLNESVNARSSQNAIEALALWHRTDPKCEIEFIINSPGGSVIEGMALFDYLTMLRRAGHKITTTTLGMAASMGGILLQAGDHRVMGKEAYILIHEVAFGAGGKIGEVEDSVAFSKMIQKRILDILSSRSTMTAKQIDAKWKRKDWWLDSDEALKLGFVDEVR